MDRASRIEIVKRIHAMIDADTTEFGDESWEADIGRFTDPVRFAIEKKKFFHERPQVIAMTADIPNPGDFYATDIAGLPILLVRGDDGKARAFLNACRHRGVQLAEGCGSAKRLTCPYHGWAYGLDGSLVGVPSRTAFEASQLKERDLIALPTEEQIGLILVHPQPGATLDFDAFMGGMKAHMEGYGFDNLRLVSEYRAPARINWKHAVDGGVEGYHVPFLHPETVGPMTLKQFLHLDFGLHHALITAVPQIASLRDMPEEEWPEFCHFSSTNAIFPNTVVGGGELIAFFQRTEPGEEPGSCTYIFRTYGWDVNAPEEIKQRDKMIADMLIKVALDEDMKVQSSSQIMMEAGAVPSIVFGKREINLIHMHKNYDRLIGHDAHLALAAE